MKKFYLCLFFSAYTISHAFSQDSLKVSARHVTMELNINPFQGDLSLNNALNQIKLRYFTSDNFAIRLGFNVDLKKKEANVTNPYGTNPFISNENKKYSSLSINLGIEKHFSGTKRLSPYVGGEIALGTKSSNYSFDDGTVKTEMEGAWRTTTVVNNSLVTGYEEKAYFSYGLNLIAGFDFYVAKNFFVGYEGALQYTHFDYSDIDVTNTGTVFPPVSPDSEETETSLSPKLLNGIRIGYVF